MKSLLLEAGYHLNYHGVWSQPEYSSISYNDGDEAEERIAAILAQAQDTSVLSRELRQHCTDWPSYYHFSSMRANIMRPFEPALVGANVLEIGSGCGAITRYLGECGAKVLALEGSYRRAAITRSRTRDLPNVEVITNKFDYFSWAQPFDVITLVGVLEYANLFTSGRHPALAMLQTIRTLLKPHGKLILAIENQLGLKYFAGAAEDHIGQPMYGIEGRYLKDQPQTYGHKVLADLLFQANFANSEFLVPMPDYKFARSIVTETGFSCEKFDVDALLWQSSRLDPQLPTYPVFSLELAWRDIIKNGMALDLANSFLVVAENLGVPKSEDSTILAYHYSSERAPLFCKETKFIHTNSDSIQVQYRMLMPDAPKQSTGKLLHFRIHDIGEYVSGYVLSLEFIKIVSRDGWHIEDAGTFFCRYLDILLSLAFSDEPVKPVISLDTLLPGRFFDTIPRNIIITPDGSWRVIDEEWELAEAVSIGYIIFRSLLSLINTVSRFGYTESIFPKTQLGFLKAIYKVIGLEINETTLHSYWNMEQRIQAEVSLASLNQVLPFNIPLQFNNLHMVLVERNEQMDCLNHTIAERDKHIDLFNQTLEERDEQINNLKNETMCCSQALEERDEQISSLKSEIMYCNELIAHLDSEFQAINRQLRAIIQSRSWRLTSPLRAAKDFYTNTLLFLAKKWHILCHHLHPYNIFIRKIKTAINLLVNRQFGQFFQKIYHFIQNKINTPISLKSTQHITIITPKHTLYVAHSLEKALTEINISVNISHMYSTSTDDGQIHIVICPQIFSNLPENFVAFQMEQTINPRWFSDKYIALLKRAIAVMDYSITNIEYLLQQGIPYQKLFYVPISSHQRYTEYLNNHGYNLQHNKKEASIDVLFYGDPNCERRLNYLQQLSQNFNIYIASEVFGTDLIHLIQRAKIVINIHYYENALLETTRLYEALSLGTPVISETSTDIHHHNILSNLIDFTPLGDINAMADRIEFLLNDNEQTRRRTKIAEFIRHDKQFAVYFKRYLLANDFIDFDTYKNNVDFMTHIKNVDIPKLCLSLTETPVRQRAFLNKATHNFQIIEGIRHRLGWIGCGLSYKYISTILAENNVEMAVICEDDVLFPSDFDNQLKKTIHHLRKTKHAWHIFAGMIADLHDDTTVLAVEKIDGINYVYINKMCSTVMNIYSQRGMQLMSGWNEKNHDAATNTIDRYIESTPELIVVTTLPFMVGHAEEQHSTLWGFANTQYLEMIRNSEQLLQKKVNLFKEKQTILLN